MKNVIEKVKYILETMPYTRDNDFQLFVHFWQIEKPNWSLADFIDNFYYGKYTHPESIRRARQRLQQLHPELRGEKYEKRHKHQTKVKEDLGYKP